MNRWTRRAGVDLAVAAAALAASAVVLGAAWRGGFPVDDAWIHMVYGLSLRETGTLAYNPGAPSTGCTSLLWTGFVALAHALSGERGPSDVAAVWLKMLGVGCHLAASVLASRLAGACAPRSSRVHASLGAGLLVAAAPRMVFAGGSGMEVSLTAALLTGAFLAVVRGRGALAGGLAGLAATARPEAVLAVPAVAALSALVGGQRAGLRARAAAALASLGAALVPLGAMLARTYAVSGRPLPATFYAKAGLRGDRASEALSRGVVGVLGRLEPTGHVVFAALALASVGLGAAALWALSRGRASPRVMFPRAVVGAACATGVAYVLASALTIFVQLPRHFYYQRYYLPVVPLLVVGAVSAAAWGARALRARRARWAQAALVALLGAGVALEVAGWSGEREEYAHAVENIDGVQVALGRAVASLTAPDAVVWGVDAGALRYWGRRRVVDLMGLNTPELVRTRRLRRAWAADAVVLVPAYFDTVSAPGVLLPRVWAQASHVATGERAAATRQVLSQCNPELPAETSDIVVVVDRRSGTPIVGGRCRRRATARPPSGGPVR